LVSEVSEEQAEGMKGGKQTEKRIREISVILGTASSSSESDNSCSFRVKYINE